MKTQSENLRLKHYCKEWNLQNPSLIAKTVTSDVYKVFRKNQRLVLKVLNPLGQKDGSGSPIALCHFDGNGAVELINYDEGAHLLSFVEGQSLKELAAGGKDAEATEIICQVLSQIHGVPQNIPSGLTTMDQNFQSLFIHAQSGHDTFLLNAARVADRLIKTERERFVLHGDIHHENILESSTRGWLAIDPKGLVGERAYDFANVFYNPENQPSLVESRERIMRTCSIFSHRFGIDPRRILEFALAYGALSACWAMDDGLRPERRLRIAGLIQDILVREFGIPIA